MLCKDINDSPEHLVQLRHAVAAIRPDLVHLNTVVRPPAEAFARPLSHDDLVQIRYLFGPGTEIAEVGRTGTLGQRGRSRDEAVVAARIVALCSGRPVTAVDISELTAIPLADLDQVLVRLGRRGLVRRRVFGGIAYYQAS
jgi:hypothetical protein